MEKSYISKFLNEQKNKPLFLIATDNTSYDIYNIAKALVDNDELLNDVYIKGEISNLKKHYTGHYYFTLKDKESLIKCVMFKSYTSYLNFDVEDGMNVVIFRYGCCI